MSASYAFSSSIARSALVSVTTPTVADGRGEGGTKEGREGARRVEGVSSSKQDPRPGSWSGSTCERARKLSSKLSSLTVGDEDEEDHERLHKGAKPVLPAHQRDDQIHQRRRQQDLRKLGCARGTGGWQRSDGGWLRVPPAKRRPQSQEACSIAEHEEEEEGTAQGTFTSRSSNCFRTSFQKGVPAGSSGAKEGASEGGRRKLAARRRRDVAAQRHRPASQPASPCSRQAWQTMQPIRRSAAVPPAAPAPTLLRRELIPAVQAPRLGHLRRRQALLRVCAIVRQHLRRLGGRLRASER